MGIVRRNPLRRTPEYDMILLNFGHPLTDAQRLQVDELLGSPIQNVYAIPTQFDHGRAFEEQIHELVAKVPLTAEQWQTAPLLINPPSLAPIVAVLLAELHGRCGYFPSILRLRPKPGTTPPQFEPAEIINLQTLRDLARTRR